MNQKIGKLCPRCGAMATLRLYVKHLPYVFTCGTVFSPNACYDVLSKTLPADASRTIVTFSPAGFNTYGRPKE